jgi:hypothetical protein
MSARSEAPCGKAVDAWWKACGRCVERNKLSAICGHFALPQSSVNAIRTVLRLFRLATRAKVCGSLLPSAPVTHRYEQHIAGRTYEIEVRAVSQSRWRAQIVRLPGMPSSLMPFYGTTPDEAADELKRWLALVYNGTSKQ